MAFAGKWNKTAVEGGAAFFAACGIPDDKLAAAEALVSTEVTEDGDNYCFNRTYGNGQTSTMKFTIGAESDFEGPAGPVKATVARDGGALKASVAGIDASLEVVGGQLVESWSAGGATFKRMSSK